MDLNANIFFNKNIPHKEMTYVRYNYTLFSKKQCSEAARFDYLFCH